MGATCSMHSRAGSQTTHRGATAAVSVRLAATRHRAGIRNILFALEVGVLRKIVRTRYELYIVTVYRSILGKTLSIETDREQIAEGLRASVEERAMRL